MLYPTHMFSTFNSLPQFYLSPHLLNSPPQFQGMEESIGDFGPENEVVVGNDGAAGDEFCVDELLDLSNGYSETEVEELPEMEMWKVKISPGLGEKRAAMPPEDSSLSGKEEFEALRGSELTVQAEGLESLEWLSHFVEDSSSDCSFFGKFPAAAENMPEAAAAAQEQPCFTTPVQTKARTRRARAGVRLWPVLSSSFTYSPTSSSSSSLSTTSFSPSHLSSTDGAIAPTKKQKKKAGDVGGGGAAQPRRCSHCGVTKTPQWRAGPLGAKTLCNACGVRYKSGRLLPEYRPACSPSFSSELHSNNHRKVLEMRRKKEVQVDPAGLPPSVQSF